MIRQIEEGGTKGGIIIPNDKFKEFVEFQRRGVEGKIEEIGGLSKGCIYEPSSDILRYTKL